MKSVFLQVEHLTRKLSLEVAPTNSINKFPHYLQFPTEICLSATVGRISSCRVLVLLPVSLNIGL